MQPSTLANEFFPAFSTWLIEYVKLTDAFQEHKRYAS